MKRMPYKQFNQLVQRLLHKGYNVTKPRRHGRRGMSDWIISREAQHRYSYRPGARTRVLPRQLFICPTQADFIRAARYILDGGPKPPYHLPTTR